MYKRILVPVDGSATAARGLDQALKLARGQKARVCLLHVVDMRFVTQAGEGLIYPEDIFASLRKGGARVLARAAERARRLGVKAQPVMLETISTRVSELIVRQARKWRADLIVIGTHGRSGLTRAVLGSDAEEVVRAAPAPVLLVRSKR